MFTLETSESMGKKWKTLRQFDFLIRPFSSLISTRYEYLLVWATFRMETQFVKRILPSVDGDGGLHLS